MLYVLWCIEKELAIRYIFAVMEVCLVNVYKSESYRQPPGTVATRAIRCGAWTNMRLYERKFA